MHKLFVWFYVVILFRKGIFLFFFLCTSAIALRSCYGKLTSTELLDAIPMSQIDYWITNCTCTFTGIHRSLRERERVWETGSGGNAGGTGDKLSWHLWPVLRLHDWCYTRITRGNTNRSYFWNRLASSLSETSEEGTWLEDINSPFMACMVKNQNDEIDQRCRRIRFRYNSYHSRVRWLFLASWCWQYLSNSNVMWTACWINSIFFFSFT